MAGGALQVIGDRPVAAIAEAVADQPRDARRDTAQLRMAKGIAHARLGQKSAFLVLEALRHRDGAVAVCLDDLLDPREAVTVLALPRHMDLESTLQPRGYRLLAKVPRLPEGVIDHVVDRFGNLQKIMRATLQDLEDVQGVGEVRARAIKEGLSKLAESSILDRYS